MSSRFLCLDLFLRRRGRWSSCKRFPPAQRRPRCPRRAALQHNNGHFRLRQTPHSIDIPLPSVFLVSLLHDLRAYRIPSISAQGFGSWSRSSSTAILLFAHLLCTGFVAAAYTAVSLHPWGGSFESQPHWNFRDDRRRAGSTALLRCSGSTLGRGSSRYARRSGITAGRSCDIARRVPGMECTWRGFHRTRTAICIVQRCKLSGIALSARNAEI